MHLPRLALPFCMFALATGAGPFVHGQVEPRRATAAQTDLNTPRPEQVVLNAIRAHPMTAPYPIVATWQKDKVVLAGRVGTKAVHDTAVQLAIAVGYPFRDDLVIDTGTAHFAAQSAAAMSRRDRRTARDTAVCGIPLCLSRAALRLDGRPVLRHGASACELSAVVA